jgi:hypothetical protein
MDILDLRNLQLSYEAVYDNTLRESMEDLGLISEEDTYSEERAPGVKPYKAGPTQAEVRADAKKAAKKKAESSKDKKGYGPEEKFKDWKLTSTPSSRDAKGRTVSQRMDSEAPYKTRPFSPLFTKQGSRTASAVTRATEGPGEPQSVTMPRKKSKPSREIVRKGKTEESYDYYDIILSHLLDEGYANTVENAEAIMVNMSEVWVEGIIENMMMATKSPQPTTMNNQSAKPKADPKAKPTAKPAPPSGDQRRREATVAASRIIQGMY